MSAVTIIGAGLAGCEAALTLADRGIKVRLYEAKPLQKSPAHHSDDFAEVVCSNSFKSDDVYSASGVLKAELRTLKCKLLQVAQEVRVPAGGALAVNRAKFAATVTELIKNNANIEVKNELVKDLDFEAPAILATGPLTLEPLASKIGELLGKSLYFYDAAAPIVSGDGIDYSKTFCASRYDKGDGDYINCPLSREEYYAFVTALVGAEKVTLKDFEKNEIFEGCMPIEVMAARGIDTLRFGPLKPVGMTVGGVRPFAVVQLRREDADGNMLSLVGFQTNLKFGEQKRVFGLIPALENAEFLRYGVMHRNMYINAPDIIDRHFMIKRRKGMFVAGQLSGVEGYVESIASGLIAALNAERFLQNRELLELPRETMLGALSGYSERATGSFQPMNANFGLLPPLDRQIRDKELRKKAFSDRALTAISGVKL